MALKGQNLRLFVGNRCIAAALNCSIALKSNIEERSTKDSGMFAENQVTGFDWSASAEALISFGRLQQRLPGNSFFPITIDGSTYYICREGGTYTSFVLKPGERIRVLANPTEYTLCLLNATRTDVVAEKGVGASFLEYTNNNLVDITLHPGTGSYAPSNPIDVRIYAARSYTLVDFEDMMLLGQPVGVKFNLTTGDQNRQVDESLYEGEALITGIQVSANNRQECQYQISLQGVGEFARVEQPLMLGAMGGGNGYPRWDGVTLDPPPPTSEDEE